MVGLVDDVAEILEFVMLCVGVVCLSSRGAWDA